VQRRRLHREHVAIAAREDIDEAEKILAPTDVRIPMLRHRREITALA
jgi:hypothetical protein